MISKKTIKAAIESLNTTKNTLKLMLLNTSEKEDIADLNEQLAEVQNAIADLNELLKEC
jgi:uncharacterized protein involved in exopolysaccharide biosynthesis